MSPLQRRTNSCAGSFCKSACSVPGMRVYRCVKPDQMRIWAPRRVSHPDVSVSWFCAYHWHTFTHAAVIDISLVDHKWLGKTRASLLWESEHMLKRWMSRILWSSGSHGSPLADGAQFESSSPLCRVKHLVVRAAMELFGTSGVIVNTSGKCKVWSSVLWQDSVCTKQVIRVHKSLQKHFWNIEQLRARSDQDVKYEENDKTDIKLLI